MRDLTRADSYGAMLKYWRKRAGINQMELALECDTSARHLSCVETERAQPSRHLLLRLCATLDIPLRARNSILISAGYVPFYSETGLSDPEMAQARSLLQTIMRTNEPYPTMLLDRNMDIVLHNRGMEKLFNFFLQDKAMLGEEPANLLRLVLHPRGLAPVITNLGYVYTVMVERARRSLLTGAPDQRLRDILREVGQYAPEDKVFEEEHMAQLIMPLTMQRHGRRLTIATTSATLGFNLNVTLQELYIETAYPMDPDSEKALLAIVS
ncbi:MAG: helix-turn-helix transcriptional regulator [Gammaproteobacteria bacterium]|nr:helix-turn-helix transcriptional regulator [Gammaproteobacteria bacterium]